MKTQSFTEILNTENGCYRVPKEWWQWNKGWIEVDSDDTGGRKTATWGSHKSTHCPHAYGRAFAITVDGEGEMKVFYESAISMFIKWGYHYTDEKEKMRGLKKAAWLNDTLKAIKEA